MSKHPLLAPCLAALANAKRPLLIFGWGVRDALPEARALVARTGIPVVTTWGARDLFPDCIGGFGTHGTRPANFAVQNADWILTLGTRLDTKATGSPASGFAPKAQVWMVDIDAAELGKMARVGRPVEAVHCNAADFMPFVPAVAEAAFGPWKARIAAWLRDYPPGDNPGYAAVRELAKWTKPDDVIVSDTGTSLGWMMQAFPFKGERFLHAFNNTPMGYGLPAAVGAAFAGAPRVVLVTGDGGLAVNITELATVARHDLPIKIILFNNRGHAMCRQTQRMWLGGTYPSTSYEGGLATPDYEAVALAYGLLAAKDYQSLFYNNWPAFLNLDMPLDAHLSPQVRAGRNLEDADPLLPREELAEVMRDE